MRCGVGVAQILVPQRRAGSEARSGLLRCRLRCRLRQRTEDLLAHLGGLSRATPTPNRVEFRDVYVEIGLTGAIALEPGEYSFGVRCEESNSCFFLSTFFDNGDLTVIATGM